MKDKLDKRLIGETNFSLPSYSGCWVLPGSTSSEQVSFTMPRKPNKFHIWTMKVFFGWRWEDFDE